MVCAMLFLLFSLSLIEWSNVGAELKNCKKFTGSKPTERDFSVYELKGAIFVLPIRRTIWKMLILWQLV
jgi:hypothetical protein